MHLLAKNYVAARDLMIVLPGFDEAIGLLILIASDHAFVDGSANGPSLLDHCILFVYDTQVSPHNMQLGLMQMLSPMGMNKIN